MANTTTTAPIEDQFHSDTTYAITLSAVLWRTGYQLVRVLLRSKSPEYSCRIITLIHGCVVAFIGVNQCFLIDWPFDHPEWRTSYIQSILLVTSLGYFIHDLIWCLYHQSETKLMIFHHSYSVFALYRMLKKGYSGAQTCCALGCMEVTNPLLQARWFIRTGGMYPSILFSSVETTFLIIFVVVRIVLGTYFMFIVATQPKNDWDFILMSFTIYVMSWMFLANIIKYIFTKYGFGSKIMGELPNKGS